MTRNLLSEISSLKVYSSQGVFATGDTVTIDIYKDGVLEPVTSAVCVEIGVTGNFYFALSNITTPPTVLTEYTWVMSDTTTKKESGGPERFGGWVESLPQALTPADMCRITTSLYKIDGSCTSTPDTVGSDVKTNQMKLGAVYNDGTRYFELGEYKPSYDDLTGAAYFLIPQGAIVDVKLDAYGITKTGALVPDVSTIDLKTWLDSL